MELDWIDSEELTEKNLDQQLHDVDGILVPGVYSTSLTLNNQVVDITVTVDESHINSVELNNINEAVTTMFPLMEPTFDSIAAQIKEGTALSDIAYDQENYYTSQILIQAIQTSLDKASAAIVSQNGT